MSRAEHVDPSRKEGDLEAAAGNITQSCSLRALCPPPLSQHVFTCESHSGQATPWSAGRPAGQESRFMHDLLSGVLKSEKLPRRGGNHYALWLHKRCFLARSLARSLGAATALLPSQSVMLLLLLLPPAPPPAKRKPEFSPESCSSGDCARNRRSTVAFFCCRVLRFKVTTSISKSLPPSTQSHGPYVKSSLRKHNFFLFFSSRPLSNHPHNLISLR